MKKFSFFISLVFIFQQSNAQSNYSLSFNGSSQADCGSSASVNITGTAITIEAWIYPTTFATNHWEGSIVAKDYALYKGYVLRCGAAGRLSFVIGVAGEAWPEVISDDNALSLNQWQHVAAVYNGSAIILYVNGIQVKSVSETRSIVQDAATNLMIGGSPGGWTRYFTGKIDEVRVWNVARTAIEIRSKMFRPVTSGTGLVASYQMTNGSGTSLTDNSGNNNTATLSAGVSWTSSPVQFSANALSFDGADDYVTISRQPAHDISTAITLEAWVYASKNTGVQNVICKSASGVSSGYIFPRTDDGWTNTNFWMHISGIGWRAFSAPFPGLNAWHHLAASYDGTNVKIYIDGILKTSQAQTGLITTSSSVNITLGNQSGLSEYFGGYADECRVWNIARSQAAIQADMNRELDPATTSGLVAYFTNNQGIASGTNSGLNFVHDLIGTQNGTLTNFSLTGGSSNFVSQNTSLTVLPLQWLSFVAQKSADNIILKWTTSQELQVRDFAILHSTDGTKWEKVGTVSTNPAYQYSFTHFRPGSGIHFYRLRQFDRDGSANYSSICRIDMMTKENSPNFYPNPVTNGLLNIFMNAAGIVRLYDLSGRCVRIIPAEEGWQVINTTSLTPGIYYLQTGEKNLKSTIIIE